MEGHFEIKTTLLGPGSHCAKEMNVLNRRITWTSQGLMYEADPKHAKLAVEAMGLLDAKGVSTPGVVEGVEEDAERLSIEDASSYRQITARLNYLAPDRPDIQYSVKEVCKSMSNPTTACWQKLTRIGRYLVAHPRMRTLFDFVKGDIRPSLLGCSDSDWAGDKATRKSTSAGVICVGNHWLKSWAKHQKIIALSSGEAELYAAVKTSSELMGIQSLMKELGDEIVNMTLFVDAKATIGMVSRKGWVQLNTFRLQNYGSRMLSEGALLVCAKLIQSSIRPTS